MALVLTSPPAIEPVTVAGAKAYLRIDTDDEDALVASLILTSRLHVEAALGLAFVTQGWRLQLDHWPGDVVPIPLRPVASIVSIEVLALDGTPATVAPSEYLLDAASVPPRLVSVGTGWPAPGRKAAGIEIDFTAGYGPSAADVPEPIRQAILLLTAHWYEHRDPIEIGSAATAIPASVSDLLSPFRVKRL